MLRWFPYALLVASFAIRLGAAATQPLNLDEGSHLLEASLLKSGLVPFRDFAAREPVFSLLLAGVSYVFGTGYLAGRLLSVLAGVATTWFVFLLGRSMYDQRVAVLAMAVQALTPFFAYAGSILKLEPVSTAFVAGAVFLAFRADRPGFWPAILAGLTIGVAVHVRRSSLALLPLIPYVVWLRSQRLASTYVAFTSSVLAASLPIISAIAFTNARWVWTVYGAGPGVFRDVQPTESLIAVLRTTVMLLTPHILLALTLLFWWLRRLAGVRVFVGTLALTFLDVAILFGAGVTTRGYGFGVIWTPAWQQGMAISALGLCAAVIVSRVDSSPHSSSDESAEADSILRAWLLLLVGFYSSYIHVFVDYFVDFSAVLSIIAARTLFLLYPHSHLAPSATKIGFRNTLAWGLFFTVPWVYLLPAVNPYNWPVAAGYPENNLSERTYPPALVRATVASIRDICPRGREVLTADPIFPTVAGYRVFRNLTYPIHYFQNSLQPFKYDPFGLFPDKNHLMFEAVQREIPCLVVGERTRSLLQWAPPLQRMVHILYEKRMTLGRSQSLASVDLFIRRSLSISQRPLGEPTARLPMTPVRGNWKIVAAWDVVDEGHRDRALSISAARILDGVRVSADVVVKGEGGVVIGYLGDNNYIGVRLIDSPNTTGLNVFRATPSGETSLLDVPTKAIIGTPIRLTVYAFPSWLEVQVGREIVRALDITIAREGRIGLLANYGARFSNVTLRRDLRGLLEPPDP